MVLVGIYAASYGGGGGVCSAEDKDRQRGEGMALCTYICGDDDMIFYGHGII